MKYDQAFYQLLDDYHKGKLTESELTDLKMKLEQDPEIRTEADSYLEIIDTVKFYGERKKIRLSLSQIHDEIMAESKTEEHMSLPRESFKWYWRMTAVAASVAIIAAAATFMITQSFKDETPGDYRELRRDVAQIQRSQKQIIAELAEAERMPLRPGNFSGTGFLISPNGYLVTSYHVIKEADSVVIENDTYGQLKADVVHADPKNDLAVLRIRSSDFKLKRQLPFSVSSETADLGEYVYTLGFPREDIVFGEGSVSAATGFRQDPNAYQISIPVNPGNSGGPLLNNEGDVIGVVSGVQTQTVGAAFAVKASLLVDLIHQPAIDSLNKPLVLPRQNIIKNMGRVQQIKRWKDVVFMVRVYNDK
jgi:serine protease Do